MTQRSKAVDAYIAKAPEFARPILERVRAAYHKGCPRLVETMKWSTPHFDHEGIVCSFAAFKQHVTLGFWKGNRLTDPKGLLTRVGKTDMALIKIQADEQPPSAATLAAYVKAAAALNEADAAAGKGGKADKRGGAAKAAGTKPPAKRKPVKVAVPAVLASALAQKRHAKAAAVFEGFSPTNRREYCEWIAEAKRESTREKRLAQALEWMAEGKPRNWRYDKRWGGY